MAIFTGTADPFGVVAYLQRVAPGIVDRCTSYSANGSGGDRPITITMTILVDPAELAEPDVREVGRCLAQYERPGGRQPGDRIVECDLAKGHEGLHRETDTDNVWPSNPVLIGEQGPEMVTVSVRNCERCGAGFTTTIEHRLLCNECYRSDLAPGTTIYPQPEATDG